MKKRDSRKRATLIIKNIGQLLTMENEEVCPVEQAVVAIDGKTIIFAGKESLLKSKVIIEPETKIIDAERGTVTPGFIDCHTHLIFSGSRQDEIEMKLKGASYLDILKSGGGILKTVKATREASEDELIEKALYHLRKLLSFGVTTCEIKSGYGLETSTEIKILKVIKKLATLQPVKLIPTFLGAHAIPVEFKANRKKYVEVVIKEMIPEVAKQKLAKFCDVYIEKSAFNAIEAEKILIAGIEAGLIPKIHAGQFNDMGGGELAAKLGAASADHLENVSEEALRAMALNGVVAVVLPGASFFTKVKPADCARMRSARVKVALSTDFNPGSSPSENLPLMMSMGVWNGGLTLKEAMLAVTVWAARALALNYPYGSLVPGAPADLLIHDTCDWREIITNFAITRVTKTIIDGRIVNEKRF